MNEKILVVEDDLDISKAMKLYLHNAGYDVLIANDGKEGLDLFFANDFDMGIIDMMLPGMMGIDLIEKIREKSEMPILIVSAKSGEIDKIEGLSVGADDYITKPFSPPELLARVKSSMRRWKIMKGTMKPSQEISFGEMVLNTQSLQLLKNGQLIELTATEYKILKLFLEHPNQIFSKKQICEHVNGEYFESDEKVVIVHISHIRDKIGKNKEGKDYIKTIRGLGYKIEN
ncbi:response regulator transcription factor [Acidaminobacter sp. JC074]|uniref:response regulator transcription factor n=1 Tax=Acidaminobacter sp. JC074 TaxID=2530199 RepID=UPI001F0EAD95|nr:response regulator transcription factor [Acidaminobacter sp. JC074]MCH4886388.1 response regulator transcription factor [Acidaminobacter sp. JC074]